MLNKEWTPVWIAAGQCHQCGDKVQCMIPPTTPSTYSGQWAESYCCQCKVKVMVLIPEKPQAEIMINYKP